MSHFGVRSYGLIKRNGVIVTEQPPSEEQNELEQANLMRMVVEIRQKAF